MNTNKRIISIILTLVLLSGLLCAVPAANAATTNPKATLKISAQCLYDDAFEVFRLVNQFRKSKGLSELKLDSQMLSDAMQRAAETTVNFDHNRPDGSECYSINKNVRGENIAMLHKSPEEVMQGWIDSPGHYANIVSKNYTAMGVGAIIHNGTRYWVQVFGVSSSSGTSTAPANVTKDFNIYLGNNTYELSISLPEKIYATDKESIQIVGKNKGSSHNFIVKADSFNYSSSDTKVLAVENENITALAEGSATITAKNSAATLTSTVKVNEFAKGKSHKCGDNATWEYNNKVLTISGSGEMYDYNTEFNSSGMISTDIPWADAFDKVEKVVVSDGITYVSNSAFACFNNLTEVSLPDTLTKIGDKAFSFCTKLQSITFPDSVTVIGDNTFYKCLALSDVTLPKNLQTIPANMFYSCSKLTDITIPDSVEKIEQCGFAYCTGINSITLPIGLKAIDGLAFTNCNALKEITIPFSVESVSKKAFSSCTSLSKATFLNPTTIISADAFDSTASGLTIYGYKDSSAQNFCKDNSIKFVENSGTKPTVTASGYTVTYNAEPVTKDITVNVDNALDDCVIRYSKGTSFDYNACFNSIVSLGEYWRTGAPYADRINGYLIDCATYPIAYCVYKDGCEPAFGTVNIVIEKTSPAFSFESSSVKMPWYTKGDNTVGYVNELNDLCDIKVTDIVFTSSDTSILITDRRGKIMAKRYGECTVTATYSGDNNHNAHTTSFSVSIYPVGALITDNYSCEFFEDGTVAILRCMVKEPVLTVPATILQTNVKSIFEKAFFSGAFEEVTIEQGIEHIGANAFASCYNLTSVSLPDTVTTIDDYAFSGCRKLTSITIPASVTSIGKEAFGYTAATATTASSKIEGFVIYGYKDSAAQAYAEENGFEFVELTPPAPAYMQGDVDRDGSLSILDATGIQMYIARLKTFDDEQIALADFTQDGAVDIMDATGLQMKLAGLI